MELWKQAYQAEFGTDPEHDMPTYAADIEAWRVNWQSGYDGGEDWAVRMVAPQEPENSDEAEDEREEQADDDP